MQHREIHVGSHSWPAVSLPLWSLKHTNVNMSFSKGCPGYVWGHPGHVLLVHGNIHIHDYKSILFLYVQQILPK